MHNGNFRHRIQKEVDWWLSAELRFEVQWESGLSWKRQGAADECKKAEDEQGEQDMRNPWHWTQMEQEGKKVKLTNICCVCNLSCSFVLRNIGNMVTQIRKECYRFLCFCGAPRFHILFNQIWLEEKKKKLLRLELIAVTLHRAYWSWHLTIDVPP